MPLASVGYEMDTIILYPTGANGITVLSNTRLQLNNEALKKIACTLSIFVEQGISIRNSTVSRGIWDKYREWYFKIHKNIMSRRSEWYLESFEISWAGIYPKYSEETVLFFVYTTGKRNFAFYVVHIFYLVTDTVLIGFPQHVIKHAIAQLSHTYHTSVITQ